MTNDQANATQELIDEIQALRQRVAELEAEMATQRAAQTKLIEERNLLRSLIDSLPDLIYVKDSKTRFMLLNQAAAQLMGVAEPDQLLAKTDFDIYPHDLAVRYSADDQMVIQSGEPLINREEPVVDQDGNQKWLSTSKVPLHDSQGAVAGLVGMGRDITDRKRMETALQSSQQMLRLILDHVPQSVCWKDRNSVFLGCNRRLAQDVGLETPEEIVGKTDYDLPLAAYAEHYRADDRQVMQTGVPKLNFEEPQPRPDGSVSWLRTSKIPLRDGEGAVIAILIMYEDITQRKREEEERDRLRDELIQVQSKMLAELSTPLIPISSEVVVMPLIGSIDSRRAQQVLDTLLYGIAESRAHIAILDITGVPIVDTHVASALIRAAQAVQLLGARIVLTGIRPEVAQTLVGMGAELNGILTSSSLQSGINLATTLR